MAKTGRNEPCPCGSGKKFKKCCLINGGEALVEKKREELDTQLKERADGGAPAREREPKRPPESFTKRKEEFDGLLEITEELDEETVLFAADELAVSAATCEERGVVNECFERLRDIHTLIHAPNAVFYAKWIITNDLLCGRTGRIARYFMEAAGNADRDIDSFFMIISRLAYHGELKTLLDGMRIAWPKIRDDDNIMGWAEGEFAVSLCAYEIFAHLEKLEGAHEDEDALISYLKDFLSFKVNHAKKYLLQFSGRSRKHWEKEDPFVIQENPELLFALTHAFVYYLRSAKGISYTKTKLAGDGLGKYLLQRQAGKLRPKPSMLEYAMGRARTETEPLPPEHGLCPDVVTLDVFISGMFHFMMPKPYEVAALFSMIPSWLHFLESVGLLDDVQKQKTLGELKPLTLSLLKVYESRNDDALLVRDIASAWSE